MLKFAPRVEVHSTGTAEIVSPWSMSKSFASRLPSATAPVCATVKPSSAAVGPSLTPTTTTVTALVLTRFPVPGWPSFTE